MGGLSPDFNSDLLIYAAIILAAIFGVLSFLYLLLK